MLSATLFSFLSSDNPALSCVAVDGLMALVDLIGLLSEKEVSFLSVEGSLFKASQAESKETDIGLRSTYFSFFFSLFLRNDGQKCLWFKNLLFNVNKILLLVC